MSTLTATSAAIIHATARRRRIARVALCVCLSLIALLAPLTLISWLDSLFVLSPAWRWTAFVLAVGALLVAFVAVARACRHTPDAEAAYALDQAAGQPGSYTISTSRELTGKTAADAVESVLLAHLHTTAAQLAAEARPAHPWPGKLTIAAASIVIIAFIAIAIKEDGLAIRRALQPWLNLPYTTIELHGPAEAPAKHKPFSLTGTVTGRIPKELRLSRTDGSDTTVPINPDGSFTYALSHGLPRSSTFGATAGRDGHAAPLTVELRRTPKVTAYHFEIKAPEYTGWPVSTESRPGFVVLRASEATLTLQLDIPAKSLAFITDNNQGPLPFKNANGDGKRWTVELGKLSHTLSYRIEITDEKSTFPAEPEPQMIVVIPDAPPKFTSVTSNADKFDSDKPPEEFTVTYHATDDIGLATDIFTCRSVIGRSLTPRLVRSTQARPFPLKFSRTWSVSLKDLRAEGVKPLDMVIVTVQVCDYNIIDGPGKATEAIFFEMPFPPAEHKEKKKKDGAASSGDGFSETINPLALQKEIHSQLIRAYLGIKAAPEADLTEREKSVSKDLEKMMTTKDAQKLGQEYIAHLQKAKEAADLAITSIKTPPHIRIAQPVSYSATALAQLIQAAQIEAAAANDDEGQPPGKQPPGGGPMETKYSLIKQSSSESDKNAESKEKKDEDIEKTAAALDKLRKDQKKLNKDAAKLDDKKSGQQPGDKPGSQQGHSGEKQGQPSEQQSSQPVGQQSPPSATQLAGKQDAMSFSTDALLQGIEGLSLTNRQSDPKQVAAALRTAKEFQEKTAAALRASNIAQARQFGAKSVEALDAAGILTKSLLEKQVRQSIEAQAPEPGYGSLIEDYSRRISYDQ